MRNGRKLHVASPCCVIGCQRQLYVDNAVPQLSPFSVTQLFADVYLFHVLRRITENSEYCATSFRAHKFLLRDSISTNSSRFAIAVNVANSLPAFVDSLIPLFWKGWPASSGRVAFRARVVQCSILVFARTSRFRVETFPLFSNILEYLSFRNENVSVVGMLSGAPLTFFYVGGKRKGKAKKHSFHFLARIAF